MDDDGISIGQPIPIRVKVTVEPGKGFLDRMIALVEGAERQKTPNEVALTILLVGLTIIFLIAVGTIPGFAAYAGGSIPVAILAALLIAFPLLFLVSLWVFRGLVAALLPPIMGALVIFGGFFLMNLFAAVIISAFNRENEKQGEKMLLTE